MSSIVIVLPKIEDGKRIRDILAKRGYEIDAVCSTAAAALGEMNNLNGGIVICGYKLPDMFFTDLNECMPSGFQMLLIASSRALSAVGEPESWRLRCRFPCTSWSIHWR